jgi:hypothetical protein
MSQLRVSSVTDISGTGSTYAPGHVVQVVNGSHSVGVSTGGGTWVDTGLSATITPKFTSSKILITVQQAGCGKIGADTTIVLKLVRNSTDIIYFATGGAWTGTSVTNLGQTIGTTGMDSPNTTSPITYKTQFSAFSPNIGTVHVQHSVGAGWPTSTITLMEIAQ